jgi:D-alanyl-D-alanine carboxypeptidase
MTPYMKHLAETVSRPAPVSPRLCAPLLALLLVSGASAKQDLATGLKEKLDELSARAGFPGATFSILLGDGRVLDVASGWVDADHRQPLTPESRMPAGSVGKTFVAAAILQAVDDGVLDLDSPIGKWIGQESWFPRLPNARTLTLRLLLSHRSGVPDSDETAFMKAVTTNVDKTWTPAELIAFVLDKKPRFSAGSKYFYTDMNYIIAGAVFERAVGRPLFDEIDRRLVAPFSLSRTTPSERRDLTGVVAGHLDMKGNDYRKFGLPDTSLRDGRFTYNAQAEYAGGGMISTSHDLAQWAAVLWSGRAFSAARLADMLDGKPSEKAVKYGLGAEIRASGRGPMYLHDGWIFGYTTVMLYLADEHISAAIQVNSDPMPPSKLQAGDVIGSLVSYVLKEKR